MSQLFPLLKSYLENDQAVALVTVVRGPEAMLGAKALIPANGPPHGPLLETSWRDYLLHDAHQLLQGDVSATRRYADDAIEVFFDIYPTALRLIIVGAVHIADALIRYAKPLGFRISLVDPRTAFATSDRFPHADEICHQWPDEALPAIGLTPRTAVAVITHDPKLDDPALKLALGSPAFYVGALGSPKTHVKRLQRLLAEGVPQTHLDRLHAPIGLNIGGRLPAEIALSVVAEIVAVRHNSPLLKQPKS